MTSGSSACEACERALWLFVMVLGHSRAMWGEFVLDLSIHGLRRSLVRAARAFGGVTRQWLFDNPKTVVLERVGEAVRFHPNLLDIAAALRVQPRLCAVRRPEHKGKVERAIRLRDRFLASNRPVEDWGKLLGDTAATSALLDRLLHHAHVLKCGPRSWRTKLRGDNLRDDEASR